MDKLLTQIISPVDTFLNKITMYRLVLYFLCVLLAWGAILAFFGKVPFTFENLAISSVFILITAWITNEFCAWWMGVPANVESVWISALIIVLVMPPIARLDELAILFWVTVFAMASKYILALNKKHIFNPVAIGILIASFAVHASANWWVGSSALLPVVLIGGLLVIRKIQREHMALTFFVVSAITMVGFNLIHGFGVIPTLQKAFLDSPWIFFMAIMLTEPLTTPPTKNLQIVYAALTGFLFAPQLRIGPLFTTPESALVIANIFSYIVSPKKKLMVILKEKVKLTPDTYDFVFGGEKMDFTAGQYLEWTLAHPKSDSRGNRRYFTLASAPSEDLRLGVKFYEPSSSFKKAMLAMPVGTSMLAGQLAGDFTLPRDEKQKLVFIAGGIGITPFRSIVQDVNSKKQTRDAILIHACKTADEFVYKDVFDKTPWLKTNYVVGRLDGETLKKQIPDFMDRLFYISGPHAMVAGYEQVLQSINVPTSHIKVDFFPGY